MPNPPINPQTYGFIYLLVFGKKVGTAAFSILPPLKDELLNQAWSALGPFRSCCSTERY